MTKRRWFLFLIALSGSFGLLAALFDLPSSSQAVAEQALSDHRLQAIEIAHKQNIGRLHGLHHDMRATLKQLTQDRSDLEATRQLVAQLRAVSQALDTVAATEQDHPQWAGSWSQRHARLAVLTHEMEALVAEQVGRDISRSPNQLGKNLQEMKEILDIW